MNEDKPKLKIYAYDDDTDAVIKRYGRIVGDNDLRVFYVIQNAHKPNEINRVKHDFEDRARAFPTDNMGSSRICLKK